MASTDNISHATSLSTVSYETALCVIPPQHRCSDVDKLRSLYDKGYEKWPPHVNLIYPFVAPESLPRAKEQIESILRITSDTIQERTATLDQGGYFQHRNNSTIFLRESVDAKKSIFSSLRSAALNALGHEDSSCNFHLTVGQSEDETESSRSFLLGKARLLPALSFEVESLAILVREHTSVPGETSRMRLWGTIDIVGSHTSPTLALKEFWLKNESIELNQNSEDNEEDSSSDVAVATFSRQVQPGTTYHFDSTTQHWSPVISSMESQATANILKLSSYNVLVDSEYPPARDRDPLLITTILANSALADILVLQEVCDEFLSYLLADERLRRQYPFTTHGPPSQADIGPLPSLRNVVILSKWFFNWDFVPFHRRHKGAVVASFPSVAQASSPEALPFVVAGVHLTCGLTDGSVAAKKVQLQNLIRHLTRHYPENPWIVAGDFNITTSKHTIDEAAKNKSISQQTVRTLESIESSISDAALLDSWAVTRLEGTDDSVALDADDLYEGEEGSTFNPRENALAAATSGTSRNRPQRYDRILVRSQGFISPHRFNHFGLQETVDGITTVPSDHSGLRASLRIHSDSHLQPTDFSETLKRYPIQVKHAQESLSQDQHLVETLTRHSVFPTAVEEERRADALTLIKDVLLGSSNDEDSLMSDTPMVIVPVGSYALGVWTLASDIDCLCIGSISSKTFFKLARQRIHRAESRGVRLLRKVEANTGTMLELSVDGINMDLQYCPAGGIVQRWSEFPTLHQSDPMFNLSILSLRKLKPIRDLIYIQRTIPSMASFRIAYHFIKLWAVERGVYSAKFGYLGGIHITLMLSWVCKRLAHDNGLVSAEDLILSFFQHYADFDWANDMLFDAFFHKKKPRYQRSSREPMVVLGFHAPNSNIAHTSTAPGLQVLVNEFQHANKRLSEPAMTWDAFFHKHDVSAATPTGAKEFLKSHESYVKIDIQYWGRALSKGKGLVGWVESRCINLVVDIHKSLPHLSVRIWPARFASNEESDADAYYHGCYLIGLSRDEESDVVTSKENRLEAKQTIQKTFDRFLSQVQADEKNYDSNASWIGISLAKPADVKGLKLDDREWGDYTAEMDPDSDDEEETLDSDDNTSLPQRHVKPPRTGSPSLQAPVSSVKLRPASDILNRLRWDPSLDPNDYIVGYEDRFLGAKETSLEKWKTEQTDEEFIPQHRILYFKKRNGGEEGSGEIVWERKTRVDKIFGSGVGDGGRSS